MNFYAFTFHFLLLLSVHLTDRVLAAEDDVSCPGEDSYRGCHVLWKVIRGFADFSAPSYPPKDFQNGTTRPPALTNCQCREACLRNGTCVAYDWITATRSPNCWLGTNASESALTADENNTHYALINCTNSEERIWPSELSTLQWLFFSVIAQIAFVRLELHFN